MWMKYFIHLPMKMELIERSETSAISIVTPGNYPKENILHTGHGESLKSSNIGITRFDTTVSSSGEVSANILAVKFK